MMKEKKWYVVYTKSRTEKKVYQNLLDNNLEAFLPLHKTLRQWSDRKKTVEVPLFTSYVFVKINETEGLKVLKTIGVVGFIKFCGKKAVVTEKEIFYLQLLVKGQVPFDMATESFNPGDYVEVNSGPLKELRGFLVHYHGKHKVLIRIDSIDQNLLVDIPVAFLKKVLKKSA